jgi:hypothetical protein
MSFRITGLAPEPFQHLFALSDAELAARGAVRRIADRKPGFPPTTGRSAGTVWAGCVRAMPSGSWDS